MRTRSPLSITSTEYRILQAIPRSRNYAEISKAASVSISYVSRKMEELYGRGFRVRGIFDLEALGLSRITITSEYDADIYEPPGNIKIPYILRAVRIWNGKKPLLFVYAAPPRGLEEEFHDVLGLEGEVKKVTMKTNWRIDTALLTGIEDGLLVSRYEKLAEVLREIEPYEPKANENRIPDSLDTWLIALHMRNPYVKLASLLAKAGVKQQIASYHFSRHVQQFLLYNVVRLKGRAKPPYRLLLLSTVEGEAERLAVALTQAPAIYEAYVLEGREVAVLVEAAKGEEYTLFSSLLDADIVEDFEDMGLVLEEPKSYTTPYGNVVAEKTWTLDPLYVAMRAIRKRLEKIDYNYGVYALD